VRSLQAQEVEDGGRHVRLLHLPVDGPAAGQAGKPHDQPWSETKTIRVLGMTDVVKGSKKQLRGFC